MAITHVTKEAIWLQSLMNELGYDQSTLTLIYEDNQSCIALAKNPVHHARTKHIDIQHHFIREKVQLRKIELEYISTDEMIADTLTKSLPKPAFIRHIRLMKLENDNADDNDNNITDVNQTDRTIRHGRNDQDGRIQHGRSDQHGRIQHSRNDNNINDVNQTGRIQHGRSDQHGRIQHSRND